MSPTFVCAHQHTRIHGPWDNNISKGTGPKHIIRENFKVNIEMIKPIKLWTVYSPSPLYPLHLTFLQNYGVQLAVPYKTTQNMPLCHNHLLNGDLEPVWPIITL